MRTRRLHFKAETRSISNIYITSQVCDWRFFYCPFYTSYIIWTVFVLALSVLLCWVYVSPQVPFHRKQSVFYWFQIL
jgi:hypothetical protein